MEDVLAASLMPQSHSAPLYLLYDLSAGFPNKHGLHTPPLPLPLLGDDSDDDGFQFATAASAASRNGRGGAAALRACASDVSAAAFADEFLRAGALLPLSLPPRLQRRPAYSAGTSAATSPTSSAAAAAQHASRKHRGFDPFAAALEKVRRERLPAAAPRRARSLSPLRAAAADASSAAHNKSSRAPRPAPTTAAAARKKTARRGVRHLLCRVVVAGAAAVAPKSLWPRRKDGGVSYRAPGLLVCLGYGV
ncbi:unnamed protein product [Urochloa decumbens]|uniref:Uncharacterized protein n=1 Tax=Urochloa decumbens TaxID=240449 RepID=A0ABC8ZNZ8_9POAL